MKAQVSPADPVVLLFGPTGVGKTDLIESLFSQGFEIINADSIQMYRGFDIGSAKVSQEAQQKIPHHLIDWLDPTETLNVAQFVAEVDRLIPEIYQRGNIPLISGGTGFYIKNFLCGLPETPNASSKTRKQIQERCEQQGLPAMYQWLTKVDSITADRLPATDQYRILRALEVYADTGKPLSSYKVPNVLRPGLEPLSICLTRPKEVIQARIVKRVDQMFAQGLAEEVRGLLQQYPADCQPMRGIGYQEFTKGYGSEAEIRQAIIINSRRYAKRQMTFFTKIPSVQFVEAPGLDILPEMLKQYLAMHPIP